MLTRMTDVDRSALLAAYDTQLRREGEVYPASSVTALGPLLLATFGTTRGFITYATLDSEDGPATAESVRGLVTGALEHFRSRPEIRQVEWKSRGHDHAPGLHEALVAAGFVPEEAESVMVGDARLLALDVELPEGVTVRQVRDEADVRAMMEVAGEIFGDDAETTQAMTDELLTRLREGDPVELWVAEVDGRDRQHRPARARRRHGVRGGLGRGDPARVPGSRDLPCPHRGPGPVGDRPREAVDQQRLDRVLASDPRAVRAGQGHDDDALRVEAHGCGHRLISIV